MLDAVLISSSKSLLSSNVAVKAKADAYGLRGCKYDWGHLIKRSLTIDVYELNAPNSLTESERNCIKSKLESAL